MEHGKSENIPFILAAFGTSPSRTWNADTRTSPAASPPKRACTAIHWQLQYELADSLLRSTSQVAASLFRELIGCCSQKTNSEKIMHISRAVITAAGPGQQALPLQQIVNRHGTDATALELILDEVVEAGVEEICVVICPGFADQYSAAAGVHASRLTFVEQSNPAGYGDALLRSESFVGNSPFLHLVGDHLYVSSTERGCARQVVELATAEECAVSGVQSTRENMLPHFGTVGGQRVANRRDLYEISNVIEKPTPTVAEQELVVAGLRASHYLCLFGVHVLPSTIMTILREMAAVENGGNFQLSPALAELARRERYLALQVQGSRYNIGMKYGLLRSQLALALAGDDRDQILTELLELVATRNVNSVES